MTGKTIKQYSSGSDESGTFSNFETLNSTHSIVALTPVYSVMEVATAVSFMTGIIHVSIQDSKVVATLHDISIIAAHP